MLPETNLSGNHRSESGQKSLIKTGGLTRPIPQSIFSAEIIDEIKNDKDKPITPLSALEKFGIGIDKTQTPYLDALLTEVDHQLFIKGQDAPVFKSQDIEWFIQIINTGSVPFSILECSTLTAVQKEGLLQGNPEFLSPTALEQREKDWER